LFPNQEGQVKVRQGLAAAERDMAAGHSSLAQARKFDAHAGLYGSQTRDQNDLTSSRQRASQLVADGGDVNAILGAILGAGPGSMQHAGDFMLTMKALQEGATPESIAMSQIGAKVPYQHTAPGLAVTETGLNNRNIYNVDSRDRTARRGQDITAGTTRRGQDLLHERERLKPFNVPDGATAMLPPGSPYNQGGLSEVATVFENPKTPGIGRDGKPLALNASDVTAISKYLNNIQAEYGEYMISDADYNAVIERAADIMISEGIKDIPNATRLAFDEIFGTPEQAGSWWSGKELKRGAPVAVPGQAPAAPSGKPSLRDSMSQANRNMQNAVAPNTVAPPEVPASPVATAVTGSVPAARPPVPKVQAPADIDAVIAEANAAIQRGADPAAVRARLMEMGITLKD